MASNAFRRLISRFRSCWTVSCAMQLPRARFGRDRDAHDAQTRRSPCSARPSRPDEIQTIRLCSSRTPIDFNTR
jgi:hypothetical protein